MHADAVMPAMPAAPVERIACAAVPDLAHASWSNALRVGPELIVSGQTAHPAAREAVAAGSPLDAYAQTLVVLRKIQALAEAAGGGVHNILKLVVYVTDIADKDEVGRARRDFFEGQPYPASTLVAVSALVFPELRVEIDATVRLDADLRSAAVR
jgi:2-iminobutanoate/2-iminopropanoate deaminase